MAAFATVDDLAAYLDETIPLGDPAATLMLELASASIRAYTRQQIDAVNGDTATIVGTGSNLLLLPELPVRDVASVTVDETALDVDAYAWDPAGMLKRSGLSAWAAEKKVVVVYDHGYETIPDDLRLVCLAAAARGYSNPIGVAREQIGSYSVAYPQSAFNQGATLDLLGAEKRILDNYRHRRLA